MGWGDLLRMGTGLLAAGAEADAQNRANAMNERRYAQLIGGYGGGKDYGQGEIADLLTELNRQSEGISADSEAQTNDLGEMLKGEFARRQAGLQGEIDALHNRNMGRVATLGQQERKDIAKAFHDQNAANQAGFRSRGLGNSTVGAAMAQGSKRNEMDAQGGLNERLTRMNTEFDTAGTNQRLANLQATNSGWMNLLNQYGNPMVRGSEEQGIREAGMRERMGNLRDLTGQRLNVIGNRNDTYAPSTSPDLFRQLAMKPPKGPNDWEKFVSGGGGAMLGSIGGAFAAAPINAALTPWNNLWSGGGGLGGGSGRFW